MRLFVQHFLLPTLLVSFTSATTNPLKLQRRREKLNFRKNRDLEIAEKTTQRQTFLKNFQQKKVETLIQKAGLYEAGSRCLPELDFTYSAAEFEASEQILNSFVDDGAFSNIKGFKGNLFFTKIPEKFQNRDFYLVAYGGLGDKKNLFRVTADGETGETGEQVGITVEHAKFKKYKKTAFKLSFDDGVWFDGDGKLSLEIAHFAESDGSFINWYYCYKERVMVVDDFRSVAEVSQAPVELMSSRPTTAESTTAWFESTKKLATTTKSTTTKSTTTISTTIEAASTEKPTTKPQTTEPATTIRS